MIVIVAGVGIGFPDGMAATARITCYARGLLAAGHDVLLLCVGPSETDAAGASNTQVRGVADGVRYEYTCGSTVRSASFWRRRRVRLAGLAGAAQSIRRASRTSGVDAILLYSQRTADALTLRCVSRCVGAPLLVDVSEIPYQSSSPRLPERVRLLVYGRTFYRWFDAAIVISESLRLRVVRLGRRGVAVCKVPVMVDTDEWREPLSGSSRCDVVYSGTLDQEKDGVVDLMLAFRDVAEDLPGARLVLIGDAPWGSRVDQFRDLAAELGIADRVRLTGRVPRRELPRRLADAAVLVLARPRSRQGEAGMPTKVAEYLASGVPTVLTTTGDIARFVEDGVSAYLVPPGDRPALVQAIRRVLSDRDDAGAVGRRGREVAARYFDYRVAGDTVSAFIARVRGEGRAVRPAPCRSGRRWGSA